MKKPSIRYALIALAITFVWMIIEHVAGWNTTRHDIGQYTRMLPMVLFWVLIFVTVNQSRGSRSSYSYSEAFRDGVIMSAIYCAGFTILIMLYQKFINPEFFTTLKAFTIEQMKQQNMSDTDIDNKIKDMDMSFNGSSLSFFLLFVFSFGWGMIMSAIAARVYRIKS